MQNLLPLEEKKKTLSLYRVRLAVVAVVAIIVLVVVGLVLLAPLYWFAVSRHNTTSEELTSLEVRQRDHVIEKEVVLEAEEINKKINLLLADSANKWLLPSMITEKILQAKGSSVRLFGFSYDLTPGKERVVVSGIATNRESLSTFVEILKKDPRFVRVEIPISSYVKSNNINFSVTIMPEIQSELKKK